MIFVNCHEPKEIQQLLSEKTLIQVKNFTPGDYLIGNIAIERKTYTDFLSSLGSGRLFEQLERLRSCYQVCYLIIEIENIQAIRYNKIIYGPIITILSNLNVKIIFTYSKKHTVHVILLLASNSLRYRDIAILKNKHKQISISHIPLQILTTIPGIGKKRAKLLLKHFSCLKNIINAKISDFTKHKGVGRNTGKAIRNVFSLEFKYR
ncbi:MAG: ERCC4 domain-containing protein [Candidatus Woesearchaeota archaeon]